MSSVWITQVDSSVDLTTSSSVSILNSIYGLQVPGQVPLSQYSTTSDDQGSDSETVRWLDTDNNSSRRVRPRSALPLTSSSKVKLKGLNDRSTLQLNNTQYSGNTRPKTALPNTQIKDQNGKTCRKRPLTALAALQRTEADCNQPVFIPPIRGSQTPVALSNTPQYFDFWNEKQIKPRDWSKERSCNKKFIRPKSSSVAPGYSFNKNRQRKVKDSASKRKDNELEHSLIGTNIDKPATSTAPTTTVLGKNNYTSKDGKSLNIDTGMDNVNESHTGDDGMEQLEPRQTSDQDKYRIVSEEYNNGSNGQTSLDEQQSSDMKISHDECANGEQQLSLHTKSEANGLDMSCTSFLMSNTESEMNVNNKKSVSDSSNRISMLKSGNSMNTRFNLPIDMKTLETLSPMQYIRVHCRLSHQRKFHYGKIYRRFCKQPHISKKKDLVTGVYHALHQVLAVEDIEAVCKVLKISGCDLEIDAVQFGCICAVAERLYGRYYLPFESFKELIEVVDFHALSWKLQGCKISKDLETLLLKLSS